MKTMIPAAAGTFLLVPFLEFGSDDLFYDKTRVPIVGWANYSALPGDDPKLRTAATPITPFWPDGVSQAAGYLMPDDQGGFTISVPFAKRSFTGANAMAQYDHFAEEMVRAMETEKGTVDLLMEPADLAKERAEDRDEGDMLTLELEHGTYRITPAEDTREVGSTNTGGARRTKDEIAADETFLEIVKGLGKTIRAVNSRWKSAPSRIAVLRDLSGVQESQAEEEQNENTTSSKGDEDEDLIG